jgi:hypothetical protein
VQCTGLDRTRITILVYATAPCCIRWQSVETRARYSYGKGLRVNDTTAAVASCQHTMILRTLFCIARFCRYDSSMANDCLHLFCDRIALHRLPAYQCRNFPSRGDPTRPSSQPLESTLHELLLGQVPLRLCCACSLDARFQGKMSLPLTKLPIPIWSMRFTLDSPCFKPDLATLHFSQSFGSRICTFLIGSLRSAL